MRAPASKQIVFTLLLFMFAGLCAEGAAAEPTYPSLEFIKADVRYSGKTVAVGGRTIVGIGIAEAQKPMYFSTWTPAGDGIQDYCLNITSQSGGYFAQALYRRSASDSSGGRHHLPYKPDNAEYLAHLKQLGPTQIGLLLETSACDATISGPYLLAAWRSEVESMPPHKIHVMVNSRSSDQVAIEVYANTAQTPKYGTCKPVPAGRRQGFDRICEVDLHDANRQKIVVTTFSFGGDRNPPVEAEIIVPR
jgi:hypothetical protein